jgi:G3E family GTPase
VSGYLGAGKTSLINRIISATSDERLCIIVNDFGDLSIDAEVLRRTDGLTLSLPNGCICCSAATGLFDAFDAALTVRPPPTRILIEASGVADPARLRAVAAAEPDLEPAGIVTVVDCVTVRRDLGHKLKGPDILRQIKAAQAILLSKADLVGNGEIGRVRDLVSAIAPGVPVFPTMQFDMLYRLTVDLENEPGDLYDIDWRNHHPENIYNSCSIRCGELTRVEPFMEEIKALGPSLLRLKGLVLVSGSPSPLLLNFVSGRSSFDPIEMVIVPTETSMMAVFLKGSGIGPALRDIARRYFSSI